MSRSAAERVAASRAAITLQWVADTGAARGEGGAPPPPSSPWGAVAGWALDLAGGRESVPPLRAGLRLACSLCEVAISPLAQRHPLALAGAAALGGALLVSARPWRWLLRPPALSRLFTQVALAAVAQGLGGRPPRRAQERDGPR